MYDPIKDKLKKDDNNRPIHKYVAEIHYGDDQEGKYNPFVADGLDDIAAATPREAAEIVAQEIRISSETDKYIYGIPKLLGFKLWIRVSLKNSDPPEYDYYLVK